MELFSFPNREMPVRFGHGVLFFRGISVNGFARESSKFQEQIRFLHPALKSTQKGKHKDDLR